MSTKLENTYIGCTICVTRLKTNDENVSTTCGHIYHKLCLTKWFASSQELNGGQITCPECRAIIPKNGMKPVYLQFFDSNTEPDYIKLENNHQKIIQELRESVTKIKKITQELQCEKLKNVRMGRQLMMVNQKWLKAKNEIEQMSGPKKVVVKADVHVALNDTPIVRRSSRVAASRRSLRSANTSTSTMCTKTLRNRVCTYRL